MDADQLRPVTITNVGGKRTRLKKLPNKPRKRQNSYPEINSYPEMSRDYWMDRCLAVERRNDQLVREIIRLKGGKPLTKEQIEDHNRGVAPVR